MLVAENFFHMLIALNWRTQSRRRGGSEQETPRGRTMAWASGALENLCISKEARTFTKMLKLG